MSQISSLPISVFENPEFGSIRVTDSNGEPWFVAADVCQALGLDNVGQAVASLEDDEKSSIDANIIINDVHGGRAPLVISEPGLYSLVLRSRKPEAKKFKRWITHDVLPTIRRHGAYLTPSLTEEILTNPDTLIRLATDLKAERERRAALEAQVTEERPLVNFAKAVQASEGTILVKQLAGFLKQNGVDIGQNRLFEWMRQNGYLCRERGENWNKPTQRSLDLGLFQLKESISLNPDGTTRIFNTAKVTGKGQCYFLKKFGVKEVA
jgi:prophage antirepressor-like protein